MGDKKRKISESLALASTCYSICGSALAELKSLKGFLKSPSLLSKLFSIFGFVWFAIAWLPLVTVCYSIMAIISSTLAIRDCSKFMTSEECDILQSILRKRGDYGEAFMCVMDGLNNLTGEDRQLHTRSLLLLGKAECQYFFLEKKIVDDPELNEYGKYQLIPIMIAEALKDIKRIEKNQQHQAIRIYRQAADLYGRIYKDTEEECILRAKAKSLAEKIGAKDQLMKVVLWS